MKDLRAALASYKRLLFDGAMGTELQKRGLTSGISPEVFCLENPHVLEQVHADYCAAGADILTTNTFGGTRCKLPPSLSVIDFNTRAAAIAKQAAAKAGRPVWVGGSVGPTGKFLAPLGELAFEELVGIFQEQMQGLLAGGVDFFLIETQFDIAEARAAVIAARRLCSLPVAVSMTYENGVTLTGSSVAVCTATLCNMGVDLVGMNCSAGPQEMQDAAGELLAYATRPVFIQPNAGLPELQGERTVFPMQAESFADACVRFAAMGAQGVGGCCGTSPEHIRSLKAALELLGPYTPPIAIKGLHLTSRSSLVTVGEGQPFCLIGERINPTGKKLLTAELQAGEFGIALRFAEEQLLAGAQVIDVNVGAPLVDEVALLPDLTMRLFTAHAAPLSLDTSNIEAMEKALSIYPASPLVNSISGEAGRMERLGPLCRDYGAPFVLLPLRGRNLPETALERIAIIEDLLTQMDALCIPRSLAIVDILALTVSSNSVAARECVKFIRYCRDVLKLPTVCGLSNISFGLPARDLLNGQFLAYAAGAGLSASIANPSSPRVAEAVTGLKLLQGFDSGAEEFIGCFSGWEQDKKRVPTHVSQPGVEGGTLTIEQCVIQGKKDQIVPLVQAALDAGEEPFALVGERLIPAITSVGDLYEKKVYFLPQLIRSAEAMKQAFAFVQPLLQHDERAQKRIPIVVATVEGDIHDIGKNIVSLMLGNHGFEVIDLGKDVPAATVVQEAQKSGAKLVGLSALMTTTMVRMKDTVELLKELGLNTPVMVGGAVVTDAFAKSIGAHYSKDAVGAVRLARSLLGLVERV